MHWECHEANKTVSYIYRSYVSVQYRSRVKCFELTFAGNMDVINWTTVDIVFAITAASLPVLNALVPQRWRFSTPSLPQIRSWTGFSRGSGGERANRHPMRLGSDELHPVAPFSRISQLKFHNENILNQDSQETIRASTSNTRVDGTEILQKLDFQRGASLEDDRDIEKFIYRYPRSSVWSESKLRDHTDLQPPLRAHQTNWSEGSTSTVGGYF